MTELKEATLDPYTLGHTQVISFTKYFISYVLKMILITVLISVILTIPLHAVMTSAEGSFPNGTSIIPPTGDHKATMIFLHVCP